MTAGVALALAPWLSNPTPGSSRWRVEMLLISVVVDTREREGMSTCRDRERIRRRPHPGVLPCKS